MDTVRTRHASAVVSSLLKAYVESVAFVTDAADQITDVLSATQAAFEPSGSARARLDACSATVAATRYLTRMPGQVATLSGLLGYLRKHSKLDDEALQEVMCEQFNVVDDDLVFLRSSGSRQPQADERLQAAEAELRALGYTDLRRDVGLARLPDDHRRAALVAFEHDQPMVLAYLCTDAELDESVIVEQARVMAKSLSAAGPQASLVLLRGQSASSYLNADSGERVDNLPAASAVQA